MKPLAPAVWPIAGCLVSFLLLSGCGARQISLPRDPGTPLAGVDALYARASQSCRDVTTLTAEIRIAGRAGSQPLRGTIHAGFKRPASMRLEMVTGFGAPAFILVARGGRATLLVPGERRIVTDAPPEDVLGALTGVPLAPADLLAMLTGCVEPDARAAGGRTHGNGWVSVDLTGGSTVYLVHPRPESPEWRARAARRGAWRIEYPDWPDGSPFPASVRLFSTMPIAVRLEAHLSQVETSAGIDDEAFSVRANGAQPMTLDELKANGPLRGK